MRGWLSLERRLLRSTLSSDSGRRSDNNAEALIVCYGRHFATFAVSEILAWGVALFLPSIVAEDCFCALRTDIASAETPLQPRPDQEDRPYPKQSSLWILLKRHGVTNRRRSIDAEVGANPRVPTKQLGVIDLE